MRSDILIPSPGESVQEVVIAAWLKADGAWAEQDEEILELESEKATLMVAAPLAGRLKIDQPAGATVQVGQVVGGILAEESAAAAAPLADKPTLFTPAPVEPPTSPAIPAGATPALAESGSLASPAARKLLEESGLTEDLVSGSGRDGRITKGDVLELLARSTPKPAMAATSTDREARATVPTPETRPEVRSEVRTPLSPLRLKLGERLVAARNQTAMLTTFNEADMSAVKAIRQRWRERFRELHEVDLGFMSFFAAAVARTLAEFPQVNSRIDGAELVQPAHVDLGIAVSAPKGLVVPVIRNAQLMGLDELEAAVTSLAARARDNRITLEEMAGGTFTISNGGVFGSLLSTPIINPPQCAILGLHAIQDRPVAIEGRVEIRPMMYLALSYDHRVIDGRESVGFLKRVKELVEDPIRLLLKV